MGEQPVLAPGESFEYTSGTPLQASSGIMLGTYQMVNDKGEKFDIDIPPFSLDIPGKNNQVNCGQIILAVMLINLSTLER